VLEIQKAGRIALLKIATCGVTGQGKRYNKKTYSFPLKFCEIKHFTGFYSNLKNMKA
jgi:hypothetical protein